MWAPTYSLDCSLVCSNMPCGEGMLGNRTCGVGDQSTLVRDSLVGIPKECDPSTFSLLCPPNPLCQCLLQSLYPGMFQYRQCGEEKGHGSLSPQVWWGLAENHMLIFLLCGFGQSLTFKPLFSPLPMEVNSALCDHLTELN